MSDAHKSVNRSFEVVIRLVELYRIFGKLAVCHVSLTFLFLIMPYIRTMQPRTFICKRKQKKINIMKRCQCAVSKYNRKTMNLFWAVTLNIESFNSLLLVQLHWILQYSMKSFIKWEKFGFGAWPPRSLTFPLGNKDAVTPNPLTKEVNPRLYNWWLALIRIK